MYNIQISEIIWVILCIIKYLQAADDDYNVVRKDGSFEFGYTNRDSYHIAEGNRNNVVRGEFGGRNPKTGGIDSTIYTAGPRGYRPRGKNIYRNYDLRQNGPPPLGSPDDPYADPFEDPSYHFAFRTPTYNRQEDANRLGDVKGKFSYLDDVGERHNVEFIAGKTTGYHVKTPFPDSSPPAYGNSFYRGRGRPFNRGRSSIQRGLDGSYKFVAAGPDQRRTEVSDATGHVRGSYTYLDDKGVQHSVHYIAGPETGYRVLKTVKGAHLPAIFPFSPEYSGFHDITDIDGAESGTLFNNNNSKKKPTASSLPSSEKGSQNQNNNNNKKNGDDDKDDNHDDYDDSGGKNVHSFSSSTARPSSTTNKFNDGDDEDEENIKSDDIFPSASLPESNNNKHHHGSKSSTFQPDNSDDGDNDDNDGADDDVGNNSKNKPPSSNDFAGYPLRNKPHPLIPDEDVDDDSSSAGIKRNCPKCGSTLVTNVGFTSFNIPPGSSVRAKIHSIDLSSASENDVFNAEIKELKREQLNEAADRHSPISEEHTTFAAYDDDIITTSEQSETA